MKYLVKCDHDSLILDVASAMEARLQFTCKRCVTFDMATSKWNYRDVRIYRTMEKDEQIVKGKVPLAKPVKPAKLDQLDWVEMKL